MVPAVLDVIRPLFAVQFGINKEVERPVLLEELLVVREVDGWKDALEEVLPLRFLDCLLQDLFFVLGQLLSLQRVLSRLGCLFQSK